MSEVTELPTARIQQPAPGIAGTFANLNNTAFNRSKISDYNTSITNNNRRPHRQHCLGSSGLEILRQHISLHASHKHNPIIPTYCPYDTWILMELSTWMDHLNPKYKIIWLSGLDEAGKSTIVRLAMQRAEREGHLGASFFFSRDTEDRNTADYLFPTISYQLTQNVPKTAQLIDSIMRETPNLPSMSLKTQFRELIDRPAREGKMTTIPYPLVGIHGLNECDNERVQEKLVAIIGEAVKFQLPLRFLISSSPDSRIQMVLKKYSAFTRRISLGTSDEPVSSLFSYMYEGFEDMKKRHSQFMQAIPPPWPASHEEWDIKRRSLGQFSYVDTLLKFVGGNEYLNPVHQLNIVLRPSLEVTPDPLTSPYPELDRLYLLVLSRHPDPPTLLRILMFFVSPNFEPFPDLLDDLLNVDYGTVSASLGHVHPLVDFSASDSVNYPSTLRHVSFRDFLNDPSRSQGFHINEQSSSRLVRRACFNLMIQWMGQAARADATGLSMIYTPEVIRDPCGFRYRPSKRQNNVLYICKYLSKASTNQLNIVVNFLQAYPFRRMKRLSDAAAFLLNQLLGTMQFSHSIYFHGIQKMYEAYLLDERSSKLNFLLNPPWIFAIDLLPVTILAKFCGVEQSALLQTCYPVLDYSELRMGLHLAKLDWRFIHFVQTTKQFKLYLQDSKLKESSLIVLARQCLELLSSENNQEEREMLERALGNISAPALIANFNHFLLYLAAAKTRPLDSWEIHGATHIILNNIATTISYARPEDADMVANISKELIYIASDSPSSIRIHSCFLHSKPWADLKSPGDLSDENSPPPPSSNINSPHLSTDFRFFYSSFNLFVFRFITDSQRAGNFYLPRDVLNQDLSTLNAESMRWFDERITRPSAEGEYAFQGRDVGVGRQQC